MTRGNVLSLAATVSVGSLFALASPAVAGMYVHTQTTPIYIPTDHEPGYQVRVKSVARWIGSNDFGDWEIITTSTNTWYEEIYSDNPDWCMQGMIYQPCPRNGQGGGKVYGGTHTEGKTIRCDTNFCMGNAYHMKPRCEGFSFKLLYWGYSQVFRTTDAVNQHHYQEGPAKQVPGCREEPFTQYPPCSNGMIIDGQCCTEPVYVGDNLWVCFDD